MTNQEFESKNKLFEELLHDTASRLLREGIDVAHYVGVTLDQMWDGEAYRDNDGDLYYYEFPKFDTKNGDSFVISL